MADSLLETIDALARLRLHARRAGVDVAIGSSSSELHGLIELCGLAEVLRVEPRGQPEQREERLGVEEEAELGDAAV